MRSATLRGMGVALLILGLLGTALSVYYGLIRFYLVVIVPVFTSDNGLGALPLLAVFAGFVLMVIGPAFGDDYSDEETESGSVGPGPRPAEARTKVGGVVLIGPIPIIFGSDKKMTLVAAAIAIMVLAVVILLLL